MSRASEDLMRRRKQLIERCAGQRAELARCVDGFAMPLRVADGGLVAARFVRRHALVFGMATAVVAVMQRRRLWRLMVGAVSAWRSYRSLPFALGASAAGLAMSRRGGILQWVQRGVAVWRAFRAMRAPAPRP